jgi:hypothetical protein
MTAGDPVPFHDFRCPLLSLPLALGLTEPSLAARVPYLSATPEKLGTWEARLGQRDCVRIGIAWSGSTLNKTNRKRSMELARLLPLAVSGSKLYSLQKEIPAEDQKVLQESDRIVHFGSDFADTAALVSLMDVVISVDSAIAHLAGALGRPVWIMLPFAPDWRWLLDRDDSPWYPTAKLYRQPRIGDWDSVIGKLRESLAELVRSGKGADLRSDRQMVGSVARE